MDGPVELVNNQDPIEFIAIKKTRKRTGKNKRKSRKIIKRKIIKRNKIKPKKTNRRKRNRKNKRRTM